MTGPDGFFGRLAARATGHETTVRPRPAQPFEDTVHDAVHDAVPTLALAGRPPGAEPQPEVLAAARPAPLGPDRAAAPSGAPAPGAPRGSGPAPVRRSFPSGSPPPSSSSAEPRPRPSSPATVPDPAATTRATPHPAPTDRPPRQPATTPHIAADRSRDQPLARPRAASTDPRAPADATRGAGRLPVTARPSDRATHDRSSAPAAGRPAAPRPAPPRRAAARQVDVDRLLREHVIPAIVERGVVPPGERIVVPDRAEAARRPAPRAGTADLVASAPRVGPGGPGRADPGGSGAAATARPDDGTHDIGPPPVQVTIDRVVVTRAAAATPPPAAPARQPRQTVDHAAYLARRREGR